MKVTLIDEYGCGGGSCPTVYKTDRGTVLVQGYVLSQGDKQSLGVNIPSTETVVEVPESWFLGAVQKLRV
jgi:hypothetical protein